MRIIESFCLGKKPDRTQNEDMLFVNSRFIAVVDGATSKTAAPHNADISGGRFAAQTVCNLLEAASANIESRDIPNYLNEGLKAATAGSVFAAWEEPPAASVILYDTKSRRVISYGDCQLLLNGKKYQREKRLDRICGEKRAEILKKCLEEGQLEQELLARDVGRAAIKPDLLGSFLKYANQGTEYGFPVLGYNRVQEAYVDVYCVKPGEEVILASDGYPVLLPTLADSERVLSEIVREDPLLIRCYISTKGVVPGNFSYDDRTYVRFLAE